ncbi:MAG: tandem-95 repeat protein [Microcystis aeruginosa LE13-04]|nr:tandem-95 repeat protein [Microcystis aeruginosa LE13-04]
MENLESLASNSSLLPGTAVPLADELNPSGQLAIPFPNPNLALAPVTINITPLISQPYQQAPLTISNSPSNLTTEPPINQIVGTPGRDNLIGTDGRDRITGGQGADNLTGRLGADIFVYESLRDAGDTIKDFSIGEDKIDLTVVLESVGYNKFDPLGDGYVYLSPYSGGTIVLLDSDGKGNLTARPYIYVQPVTPAQLTAFDFLPNPGKAPEITANLVNDTGISNSDRLTYDPTIQGQISYSSPLTSVKAQLNSSAVEILSLIQADGKFLLTTAQLTEINAGTLPDGNYSLKLTAQDNKGNISAIYSYDFSLDRLAPNLSLNLATNFDSEPVGDLKTTFETVILVGTTEANLTVRLGGLEATANGLGEFSFSNQLLNLGNNNLSVSATDLAGNVGTFSQNIERLPVVVNQAPTGLILSKDTIAENSGNNFLIGTLSTLDPDVGDSHNYSLVTGQGDTDNSAFTIVGNELRIKNSADFETKSSYSIRLRTTDVGGLSYEQTFTVKISNVNEAPQITLPPKQSVVENNNLVIQGINISDVDAQNGDLEVILSASNGVLSLNQTNGLTFINGDGIADSNLVFRSSLVNLNNALNNLIYSSILNFVGNDTISLSVNDLGNTGSGEALSETGTIAVTVTNDSILLQENSIFAQKYQQNISITAASSFLSFAYNDLTFDTTDTDSINDAFEVALVDAQGNSLIHTIQPNRDAFFNITENQPSAFASGVSIAGMTIKVNLTGVTPGDATLIFRLVNNDSDTQTSVRIKNIQLLAGDGTIAPTVTPEIEPTAISKPIDFSQLSDVSSSLNADYLRTSFNQDNKTLYADFVVLNQGEYVVDSPLVVAIKSISEPTVQVVGANGLTPEGLPYYNLSNLVNSNTLDTDEITQDKTLAFLNPQEVQFTYELVFLGKLNTAPNFISDPDIEGLINKPYIYDADATDLEGDTLTYSLLTAPNGMTIESDTGKISWTPGTNTVGNYSISVQVKDGRGGIDQQDYTLSVIAPPPNRPPIITSIPVVDARVSQNKSGKIIVANDEWTLSDFGFSNAPEDAKLFAQNIADYFTGGEKGSFLGYSNNFSFTGSKLAEALTSDGHQWTVNTNLSFTLETLQQYDGVFVGGFPAKNQVLIDYVNQGGNVYLLAGTGTTGTFIQPGNEANAWKDFLNNFGLSLANQWNEIYGNIPINPSPHPIFVGIDQLYQANGQTIIDLNSNDNQGILIAKSNNGQGLYAVYDPNFQAQNAYIYDVEALDPDSDILTYELVKSPTGMWIEPETGIIRWLPTANQIGLQDITVKVSDGKGGVAEQKYQILVQPEIGNQTPVFVSVPLTQFNLPNLSNNPSGNVNLQGLDLTLLPDETFRQNVALTLPTGDSSTGSADIVFVVDESGSMSGYQAWIRDMVSTLESTLIGKGITSNRYGLIGFGNSGVYGRILNVGSNSPFGNANQLSSAINQLQINGGTEDGYDGIDEALTNLSFRQGAAINIILVTDEDRDVANSSLSFSSILNSLSNKNALLNVVVDGNFRDSNNQVILGVDSENQGYKADNNGNYLITNIGTVSGSATTKRDYIDLALATEGAAWDLNQLRNGGLVGTSFTKAFVDVKAQEIVEQLPLTLISSDPNVSFKNLTGIISGIGNGETASFDFELKGDGIVRSFDLLFVRLGSSTILGSIPVTINNNYLYLTQAVDPDNDTLTYSLLKAPTGATINHQSGQIQWQPKQGGNHQFTIQVDDGLGGRTTQDYTVTVNVGSPNNAPMITSIAPNQAAIGRPYLYEIQATDPDEDILAYYLSEAPEGVTLDRQTGRLTWTPTQPQLGNQTVKIRVLDGRGGETTQTLNLTVTPDLNNQDPQISSLPLTQIQEGGVYRYQIVANDGNGDLLTVDLPLKPDGMTLNEATREIIWQPTREQAGTHDLVIRIRDGYGGLTLQSFQITVNSLNNAPIITSNPDLEAIANLPYQYQIEAQDADGDSLSYRLENAPNGMTIDTDTGLLNWTANDTQIGQIPVTIIVKDSQGAETRQTYNLNVLAFAPNHTPEITSTPRNSVALGTSYFYALNTSDPDGDPLTINLQTAPTGMTLNQQGLITWTPEANQLGNHTVKVQVIDGRGGFIEQEWAIAVVSQRSNNQAPQILSTPSIKANINQVYQYNLAGNDPDGDPIFWSLETRPQGMSLDVTKGTIRWQPKFDQIGLHEVVIQVIDTQGATSSQRFTLAVNGVNLPPSITSVPFTRTVTNQPYTYTVVAKDPENGILTYNLGRKPNGMTIDQTGKIQWTPTQIGNYDIDVLVADNQGATTTQTYQLVVGTQAINQAPNITSTPLFVANVGNPYQYQIQASDPDGQSLTYQLIESPQGMTINTNTGLVQWNTPITGNYKVVVAAFDSLGLGVTQGYNLTAKVNSLPVIRSTTPPTGAVPGVPYRYDIQATDPDGGILTYSLDPASQAKGITLDESGRLSWTPSNSQTGIHAITLTITDAAGGKVTQSFNLTVAPDTTAPKVIINRNKNFTNKGEAVSFQVSATDNVGIANLQLLINNTPVVIDSNGVATFTPTNPGIITAKAFASDAAGNKAEATTTVNVLDPTDTEAPSVSLDLSGIANYEITAPTPIKGSVNDTNLAYYALEVAPADGSAPFKEMFRGTTPVTNGVLGVLDPTLLPNDTYQVRLVAYDVNGKGNGVAELLDVSGDLKLGNFQLSFTDLEIPVGGIPITLTRTYNTLNSNNKDDFGYGWRMEFRDADVRTSLPKDELYQELGFRGVGFKEGDAVYITLPGGKREKFTFKLEAINSLVNAFLGRYGLYKPTFVADKGSTSTLSVQTSGVVLIKGENGQVVPFSGGSAFAHYHPQDWGNYYQLTTKEGIVYNIDATTGDINSITNRNSDKLNFTDAGITSSNGVKVTFGRDTQGRITTVTDPMGKQIKYEYDSQGDLVKVTDRENNTTQFKYNNDQPHYLDEIIDPLGRTGIKNEYDENGRLTKVFNGEGKTVQLDYNPDNSLYTVKDPLGNATTYEYDLRGNIVSEIDANGGIIKRTYDDRNNLLSETNPEGEKLSYTYDSKGNKLSETDALGNVTRHTYNSNNDLLTTTDALGNVVTNTYDSRGNLLSITGLSNGTVTLAYNNNGLLTQLTTAEGTTKYEYDFRGNVTKEINPLGHEITYTYDGNGNRLTETRKLTTANGIRTLVTKTEYDSKGNIIKVTDAEGNISQTIYDAAGQKIKEIDALGRVTKYVYSEGGQLLETIYPDATPHNDSDNPRTRKEYDAANRVTADIDELGRPTQYQYDALGRLIYTIYPDLTPNDNTDNPRKETRYDKAGRVIAEVDERGNITRYTYDDAGRRTETILPDSTPNDDTDNPRILVTYDALGRQISQTDHLGRKTQFVYDNLGRPTGQIFADNTSISSTFDQAGRVIAKIDQEGNKTKYEYNALGQLTAVIDALNNRTEYGYDELENLITQKDAKANITKYEYDGIGRRIATQLPLNQHSTTQYDQVGNIVSTTDFNGEIITFIYDERNRLIKKALPNNEQVIYTYTLTGQRATETDGNGTITYQYDSRNRLLSRLDPDGVKIEYTYDAAGNRTSVNIPSGKTSYTFDEQNRLKAVTDSSNGVTTYTYDLAGNLIKTTLPNGTIETRDYDLLNRLLYLQNSNSTSIINSFRYTLDKVGNRLTVVEQDGRKSNYEYDDLYRLLEEEVIDGTTRTISYTYDAVSNRLTRNDSGEGNTTYQYDKNDRLLKEVTNGVTTNYTYDNNGNTLSKTTGTDKVNYQWNAENRLVGLDNNGDGVNEITNKYDSDGIRISQIVNGEETRFLVDKNRDYAQVLQEYTPSKIIKASYVYGHDLISQLRNSQRSFYHVDGLGSTRALTDSNGLVSDRYAYEAFGEIIKQLGNTQNLYLFAGEQRDPNLGLDYLRARYLDVNTGRFISRDSFFGLQQQPTSLHKYLYANNNPINFTDPTGLFSLGELSASMAISAILNASIGYLNGETSYGAIAENFFIGGVQGAAFYGFGLTAINAFQKFGNFIRLSRVGGTAANYLKKIQGLGPNITGTELSSQFIFNTNVGKFFVSSGSGGSASGALKHIVNDILRNSTAGAAKNTRLAEILALRELEAAIELATIQGISYGSKIYVKTSYAEWELIFEAAKQSGQLPKLYHAIPRIIK